MSNKSEADAQIAAVEARRKARVAKNAAQAAAESKEGAEAVQRQRDVKVAARKGDAAVKKVQAESKARMAAAAADKALRRHTVKSGDTLGAIAQAMLGNANRANEIFEANKDILASPSAIQIGQELKIPAK